MQIQEQVKELVRRKYSEIALQDKESNQASCCGSGCCSAEVYNIIADEYKDLDGYNPNADLGLGCGLPTQFARIKKGDVVIDLGSGAGNDAFVAGAIQRKDYLLLIETAGFTSITVQKEKPITIPDDILAGYLSADQAEAFKKSGKSIRSITVYAEKPCCNPRSGRC